MVSRAIPFYRNRTPAWRYLHTRVELGRRSGAEGLGRSMPRPAAHACAVGVPQHPHRVACLQSRPHPLLLAQRDHQRLDVHRPARVHAVLRPHPGAPRPVLHQGVWYDWAPLLLRRPSSNQGRLALAPRTHDPLLLYPQRRAPPSCFWQRKPSPCGKLPTRWNAQPLVGSTQPLRDVTNSERLYAPHTSMR
ncbi:Serine/arginine-rich splicing factor SR45a [Zea mays]|uniref:Serine/arginine-rich splicing factor SR45a n=2 Tax=Zea mays TaxID=4577 RepID=A0A1D6MGI8_MAIZE|nr:Serine/arginine-rich splicing factor SR45a [Zea mays]